MSWNIITQYLFPSALPVPGPRACHNSHVEIRVKYAPGRTGHTSHACPFPHLVCEVPRIILLICDPEVPDTLRAALLDRLDHSRRTSQTTHVQVLVRAVLSTGDKVPFLIESRAAVTESSLCPDSFRRSCPAYLVYRSRRSSREESKAKCMDHVRVTGTVILIGKSQEFSGSRKRITSLDMQQLTAGVCKVVTTAV